MPTTSKHVHPVFGSTVDEETENGEKYADAVVLGREGDEQTDEHPRHQQPAGDIKLPMVGPKIAAVKMPDKKQGYPRQKYISQEI